ncbi:hypothetical protein [uncultured Paracoccus sp.]|nr:hypothetical protein [uncultured Paracoccus sp.]
MPDLTGHIRATRRRAHRYSRQAKCDEGTDGSLALWHEGIILIRQ